MKSFWLESKTMFTLFSCSAWVVVCWGILMIFGLIFGSQQTKSFQGDNLIGLILVGAFTVVSIIAFLSIIFGMAIHCLSNRDFSIGTKILWSIFAFLTAPFGAAIYFFTVYKKQRKIHREVANA
jgi:multisubunit Na+/H+ antiporter MnhG subunit